MAKMQFLLLCHFWPIMGLVRISTVCPNVQEVQGALGTTLQGSLCIRNDPLLIATPQFENPCSTQYLIQHNLCLNVHLR